MRVLLLGDSITDYIPKTKLDIDEYYNLSKNLQNGNDNYRFYKCGMENYTTEWLRQYIFPKLNIEPYDIIVLQCGINDFFMPYQDEDYAKKSPKEIYLSIIDFIQEIRKTSGKKVALQSLYPVKDSTITPKHDIRYINDNLSKFCQSNNIYFLDMYSLLAGENGEYLDGLSNDNLHPNDRGYDVVANILLQSFCNEKESIKEM